MFNNNLLMGAASAGGESLVEIGNSALFDSANSEYLSRTPSSAGNRKTWTISYWVYKTYISGAKAFFTAGSNNTNVTELRDQGTGILEYRHQDGGSITDSIITTAVFRDIGWYHIVWAADTTQAVESSRIILYVNGERITDFSTANYPAQNGDTDVNTTAATNIGARTGPDQYWSGYMAEAVLIDGLQLTPTSFGQYDSTGTFWTPKSSDEIKALTFGTNGFYLDNTTNAQTDASGNGNNFTNNNTVVTDTHTPTNIEFLMSPINVTDPSDNPVLSNGNRTWSASSASAQTRIGGNIPFPSSGKWIAGVLITELSDGKAFGIWSDRTDGDGFPNTGGFAGWHRTTVLVAYESDGSSVLTGNNWPQAVTQAVGDQCWIAVDIDNSKTFMGYYDLSADTILWYANDAGNDGNPATGDNPFENINCAGMVWAGAAQNSKSFTLVKEEDCPFTIPTGYSFLNTTNIAANITRTKSNLEEYFDSTLYEGNGAGQRVGKFLPFTNAFTVGNSALFNGTDNSLSRTQVAGTSAGTVWTFSTWIKKCETKNTVFVNWSDDSAQGQLGFDASGNFYLYDGSTVVGITSRDFADTSQWSHYHVAYDTGESGTDKVKLTVNGVLITNWSTDNRSTANAFQGVGINGEPMIIGNNASAGSDAISLNGYMAQVVFLDGTASAASNFGQLDTSTGRWIPSDLSSFSFGSGNNTVFLDFADSDNLGDDESGQGHDFTNNNTVVQSSDSPTVNFAVFDANFVQSGFVLSNGNQTADASSTNKWGTITLPITTGKWFGVATTTDANTRRFGVASNEEDFVNLGTGVIPTDDEYAWAVFINNDTTIAARNDSINITGTIQTLDRTNDRYAVAIDCDNQKVWLGIYDNSAGNIQWLDSGGTVRTTDVPASGVNETYILTGTSWRFFVEHGDTGSAQTIDFGQSSFGGASLPSGFLGLNQDNMPEGESYQTAFSWIKNRDSTDNHMLFDRVRGIYNNLHSNTQDAEDTNVNTLQRFLNGGVQVGNDVQVNTASESYVAWNWYMETAGTGSSNTDGTINTTSTLVDTNLGLSISKYTGTGANATIGHGLGVVPEFFMVKILDTGGNDWMVYHSALGATKNLVLNKTTSFSTSITRWNNTEPTSSLISLGTTTAVNGSGSTYVCYAFAPSQFISIGSYNGNGNANGTFIPTVNSLGIPIQPAWFMARSTGSGQDWRIVDNKRNPSNVNNLHLRANTTAADTSETNLDIDTGGIKIRTSSGGWNTSGTEYIYLAFGTPIIDVDGRIITGF